MADERVSAAKLQKLMQMYDDDEEDQPMTCAQQAAAIKGNPEPDDGYDPHRVPEGHNMYQFRQMEEDKVRAPCCVAPGCLLTTRYRSMTRSISKIPHY